MSLLTVQAEVLTLNVYRSGMQNILKMSDQFFFLPYKNIKE
jgi:hypothetical protein